MSPATRRSRRRFPSILPILESRVCSQRTILANVPTAAEDRNGPTHLLQLSTFPARPAQRRTPPPVIYV